MSKKIKFILSIFAIMSLTGCNNDRLNIEFIENTTFNSGSTIDSCSVIKSINGTQITEDMIQNNEIVLNDDIILSCGEMELDEVGEHELLFNYDKELYVFKYNVIDTKAPKIAISDEIYIDPNNQFDINNYAVFIDDTPTTMSIEGNVDTTNEGKYEIKIKCEDSSGNYVEKNVWVQVGSGDNEYPLNNGNLSEERDPYAEILIKEMGKLDKPEEIEQSIEEEITEEDIIDKIEVLDPSCVSGTYEIEAENAMEAAMNVMNTYACWQVEASEVKDESSSEDSDTGNKTESKKYNVICICTKNNEIVKNGNYDINLSEN